MFPARGVSDRICLFFTFPLPFLAVRRTLWQLWALGMLGKQGVLAPGKGGKLRRSGVALADRQDGEWGRSQGPWGPGGGQKPDER